MSLEKAADAFSAALVELVKAVVAENGGKVETRGRPRKDKAEKEAAAAESKSERPDSRDGRDSDRGSSRDRDDRSRDDRDRDDRSGRSRDDDDRRDRGRDDDRDRGDRRSSRDDREDRGRDRDDKRREPMTIKELRDAWAEYLGVEDEKEAKFRGDFAKDVLDYFRVKKFGEIEDRDIDEAAEYLAAHKRGDKVRLGR